MAIRVPINPQTRVPQGQIGYERAVDVTAGARALGDVVRKYGEYVQEEDKRKELFDVQKRLVDEANNLQLDFEDRQKKAPIGAPNFTQDINDAYSARHKLLVDELKSKGYSENAVNEFETRLGVTRSQYIAKAIDFQDKSRFAKTVSDVDNLAISGSQYVSKNPNAIQSILDEGQVAISHTDLNAVEQQGLFERYKNVVIKSAQDSYAIQHPEVVLGLYGFPNELETVKNETTGELVNLGQAQNAVSTELKKAGFNNNVVAGFLGNFAVEGGYGGAQGDGGKAAGIGQWREERRANFKRLFNKDPAQATHEEQARFVVWEMQHPKDAGMTVAQRDEILNAKTPEEAARLIDKYYERSSGKAIKKRVDAAKSFVQTIAHADQTIQNLTTTENTSAATIDVTGKTGIPIIDLSTGAERIQMLDKARVVMNEREADAKAAQRDAHDTYINDFYNKLQDGTYGQSDLNAAYNQGLIKDFDERSKAQSIIDSKNKKNEDLARFGLIINGGFKANPFDKDAQKAVDAGFEKGVEDIVKNKKSLTPIQYGLHLWQRTGVLPTQAGVMIRGALIGTDPLQVAAAASVASNMLAQNPNAFAGVEGGQDIGIAAATYAHYVDDLGMNAQDAANKIAQQNSPEFKAKIKADQPQREKFINTITGDRTHSPVDIERVLSDATLGRRGFFENITGGYFGTSPQRGKFVSDSQKAEASQTYLELALEAYDKNPDQGAALKYASDQMARFYGVEQGRLMKYPPSKAYPKIQGSREYIFDQAKKDVDKFAGFPVPKENIWLQPTANGRTADAFRAGKAPPYEVHFFTERDGQRINHVIPGKVFVADIEEAKKDAAEKARKEEQRVRNRNLYTSGPQFGG